MVQVELQRRTSATACSSSSARWRSSPSPARWRRTASRATASARTVCSTSSSSRRSSFRRRSRSSPSSRSWCSTACTTALPGLIAVYVAIQLPLTVYILESFFARIPGDLFDAARIDGYSEWQIFWKVSLPVALPAIATTVILNTILLWNEFLYAVVLITDDAKRTLPLGIQRFMGDQLEDVGMIATGLMIAIIPGGAHLRVLLREADPGDDRRGGEVAMAAVSLDRLSKRYAAGHALAVDAVTLARGARRVHDPARALGLREVDHPADDRRPRGDHLRRARDRRAARERRAGEGPRYRDGVPVVRALSAHERVRQPRVRPAPPRHPRGGDRAPGARRRRDARAWELLKRKPHALSGGQRQRVALGGASPAIPGVPVRRAWLSLQPLCRVARRHARRADQAPPPPRRHHDLRHPRPGRGDDHGRPHLHHERRQGGADRRAARGLSHPGRPFRRLVPRQSADQLDSGAPHSEPCIGRGGELLCGS